MLRLLKTTSLARDAGRILKANLPAIGFKANFAAIPEPKTNPEILYTGVSRQSDQ